MPQKQEKTTLQEQTLRYSLLPLITTKVEITLIPLNIIEIVLEFVPYLQLLRYSIDYFTPNWLDSTTPIFSYLDLSYLLTSFAPALQQTALILALTLMNLYWIVPLTLYLMKREASNLGMNGQRLAFILAKNIFFLPMLNVVISLFSPANDPFHLAYPNPTFLLQFVSILSFSIFTIFLASQSFFNFEFLNNPKSYTRLKKSAFTSTFLLALIILTQVIFTFINSKTGLAVFAICSFLMFVLFIIKNQHLNETHKLIELSFLCVNLLGIFMTGFTVLISYNLSLQLFFLMAGFVVASVMKYKTYSLKFQLENINKWPTADIILKYTNNLRYYLQRKDEYLFRVYIHGYMEIHRHKCDHDCCASRAPFTDYEKRLFEEGQIKKEDQQIFRFQNVIKKIFQDGYKLTPINPELQLQNCIYLYERGEKDQSLKNLLLIRFQELSFDKYYKFHTLKKRIHKEMSEVQNLKFIDLVSELIIKHEEEEMISKLDKAAIKNLEFWSILNEDHPDFQKLNEVGSSRIQIREEVREIYNKICQIAYSQKVTSLYVQYLQAIENDEAMFNSILQGVKKSHGLMNKIVLQDWANTSQAIMVISIDEANFGSIININSSCALLFGYQKYEVTNHSLKMLFGELDQQMKSFLSQDNQQEVFAMTHKSGYMLKLKRTSQNYNSMDTGMASIITLTPLTIDHTCSFFIEQSSQKIVGITSSTIALTGIELKTFEDEVNYRQFFKIDVQSLSSSLQIKNKQYSIADLINQSFEISEFPNRYFKISFSKLVNCYSVDMKLVRMKRRKTKARTSQPFESNFEFQIQANLTSYKYIGCYNHEDEYITQFSQLRYAESLKKANTIARAYDQGISTLRLRDNIIQVIEQNVDQQLDAVKKKNSEEISELQNMPRKDEEQIFSSRSAFQQFIYNYSFARSVNLILLVTVVGLVGLYIFFYLTFTAHSNSVNTLAQQITYRNLIVGAIAKELSLVYTIQQIQKGQSTDNVPRLVQTYNDNLAYLNSIKFNGGQPYNIFIELGNGNVTFQSNEYLLSFINYAQILSIAISSAKNASQLTKAMGATQLAAMNYLLQNAPTSKEVMMSNAYLQQAYTLNTINHYQNVQVIMLAAGILFLIMIALVMLFAIHKINKERINIFEIFLDITQMQIQQFSSKTERFLTILHVEDANGEIDVEQEVENARKINSSTFAKKKKFKHINFNKSIYFRLLIIPLFGVGFFLHSFITNYQNLQFQANSYHYFFLTSQGDYNFYSGMADIQRAYLTNTTVPTGYSQNYILYYRDYFDLHYNTFGYINDFHQAFTTTFMLDICNGASTIYGNTQVPESCSLPLLYPNGSYLVFTDMAMKTAYLNKTYSSLSSDYITSTQVLSKTHRKMSNFLIQAEATYTQQTLSNLLTALIVWILVMNIVGFVYGVPIMKRFVDEINEIKNILSLLPISLARELPLATPYFNKIIRHGCCN